MALVAIPLAAGASVEIPNFANGGSSLSVVVHGGTTVTLQASANGGSSWATVLNPGVTNYADSAFILDQGEGLVYRLTASAGLAANFYVS